MGKYHVFSRALGLLLLLALLGPLGTACAKQPEPPGVADVPQLLPDPQHGKLDQVIAGLLTRYHYRQEDLSDEMSAAILDSYLDALDFSRSYFLAGDIQSFERYRHTLDDALKSGNLTAAYEIFNIYQQRVVERNARIQELLDDEFDFTVDESLELDREEAPWAKSQAQLDEIWRKRLKHELLNLMLAGQELEEARETLHKRYANRERLALQSTSEDVFQSYMNAVSQSFDPHTAYLSPRTSENFNIQMRLSLEGIGAVLRMEDEQIVVVELVPGGPADLSKQLKPNDRIVAVGQGEEGEMVDVIGWRLDDVVELIRGPRGTVVKLRVVPGTATDDSGKEVRLVRNKVQLEEQAAKSEVRTLEHQGRTYDIGVITIPAFYIDFAAAQRGDSEYRSTTRDVRRLIQELQEQNVDGLVIDLRQNGGGALQEAVELTGLFIDTGPVVQVRDLQGGVDVEQDPDKGVAYEGPLAVLVDRFSASASEIFAGAIQDYGRGIVIGEPTFGKGTVQTLIDLNRFIASSESRFGQLKLTVAKFYRVSGSSTQHKGVVPDILFPSPYDSGEVGESARGRALPWDEIVATSYRSEGELQPLVPLLAAQHQQRIDQDPAFATFMEQISATKKAMEQTRVSLMESRRRAERERDQSEQLEWENRLRLARGLEPLESLDDRPEDEKQPDLLLDESVQVMADLIGLLSGGDEAVVVNLDKAEAALQ